mgnify:CR=1 FL=1
MRATLPFQPADIHACLLDLDGTLVDTLGDFELALAGMLTDLGRQPLTRVQIEPVIGKGTEHLVRTVLQMTAPAPTAPTSSAPTDEAVSHALTRYHAHYARINGHGSACGSRATMRPCAMST